MTNPKLAPGINPDAAKAEVEPPETIDLDWNGVALQIASTIEDADPDVVEAFENGKAITALRALFGSDEYDRARRDYKKLHGRRPTMKDIGTLADLVAEHFGFETAGE